MNAESDDFVKQQVRAHWDRRASQFDNEFGHSVATSGERAAWDRALEVLLRGVPAGAAGLDVGCGTGFLAFELAARGLRMTGIDFAPLMIDAACRKAVDGGGSVSFEQADAEDLPFPSESFDLVISRHLLWTLPHPEQAIDSWIRVTRPGGRVAIVDGQFNVAPAAGTENRPILQGEYAAIADRLPFMGGRPQEEVLTLLRDHGLTNVGGDSLLDLVAAQAVRAQTERRQPGSHRRYLVWGDLPL